MEIVNTFDQKLVDSLLEDISFNFVKEESKFFVGFKENIEGYFSFFISLYKNQMLLFTFRENVEDKSVKRIYVSYESVNVIRQIIKLIAQKEHIDEELYKAYLYEEPVDERSLDKNQKCDLIIEHIMGSHSESKVTLDNCNISYRLKNILNSYGIYTVEQFLNTSDDNIFRFKNMGQRTFDEVLRLKKELNGDVDVESNVDDSLDSIYRNKAGSKWTHFEEKRLIEEFYSGKTTNEIAKLHGRSRGAIRRRLFRLGLIK